MKASASSPTTPQDAADNAPPLTASNPANEGTAPRAAMQAYAMLESLPEALLLLTDAGVIQAANAAAEPLLMQSRRKLIGQPLSYWISEEDAFSMAMRQCWLTQNPQKERTFTLQPRHQAALPVRLELWPVMDAQGAECCGLLARLRAVNTVQTVAPPAQDSAAYMAAVLAHEIKNPLSGIRGAAQLIAPHLPEGARAMGQLILREVDRIRGLVDQMEIFNQPKNQTLEIVNIHEVLRHAALLIRTATGSEVEIIERFDPSLPDASAHKDALTQIVLNLMKNGLEAMQGMPATTLTLMTDYHRDGAGHSSIRLRVVDQGSGIPESIQHTIFEPFVTTKSDSSTDVGRGLGLAVCAKLSQDMGGRLQLAESRPGYTCFELLLAIHR